MGLDQTAYYENSDGEQTEICYWRKHNRLQGWMEQLWRDKGKPNLDPNVQSEFGDFNCIPLPIDESDLEQLEAHVCDKNLPETGGFFFGDDSFTWEDKDGNPHKGKDYFHKETDLDFIEQAREAIKNGNKVFYHCWY